MPCMECIEKAAKRKAWELLRARELGELSRQASDNNNPHLAQQYILSSRASGDERAAWLEGYTGV